MAEKVLVARVGQKNAKPVLMDARLARSLVARGRLQYVTTRPPVSEVKPPEPSAPPVKREESGSDDEEQRPRRAMTTRDMKTEESDSAGSKRTVSTRHYKRRDERAEE